MCWKKKFVKFKNFILVQLDQVIEYRDANMIIISGFWMICLMVHMWVCVLCAQGVKNISTVINAYARDLLGGEEPHIAQEEIISPHIFFL